MDTRCPECEPVVLRTRNSGRFESLSVFERIGTQGASAPLKRQVRMTSNIRHGGDSRFLGGGKIGDQWWLGITLSADFQLFSLVEKGIILRRFYDKGKSIGNLRRGNRRKGFIFAAVVT